jgi:sulfide:quinone oxidoreductase
MSCDQAYQVVILGGGAGGIATAASLLRRSPNLRILIVEPSSYHYYQPGWTLVGGGVFQPSQTRRKTADVLPKGIDWAQTSVSSIEPQEKAVTLTNGAIIHYEQLIVALGLELNWKAIKGLDNYLGTEGITSNYAFEHAPYTFELIRSLKGGTALFTQPSMPIKCAGAPQKAMYLACSYWEKANILKDIEVTFYNAGESLFGVRDYLPALLEYIDRYGIKLQPHCNLIEVDALKRKAFFETRLDDGSKARIEKDYDMLHICPPQTPPSLIKASSLSNETGWLEVNPETLQHMHYPDIFGIGDVIGTSNAKTAAAVRKQAPVLAQNLINHRHKQPLAKAYQGYGSCPLTVEHGKIVLAEFGYQGVLQPTFPEWFLKGKHPTRIAWHLKTQLLPSVYWHLMLKGREWLT